MKQTVEEAANKYRSENVPSLDKFPKAIKKAFIAGTEWQAKQSPWISVKEQLPEYYVKVIICHDLEFYVGVMYYSMLSNWWRVSNDEKDDLIVDEDDSWMPIPTFDQILEANKDVLQFLKEKGD